MLKLLRKLVIFLVFGGSASTRPAQLNDEQRFVLNQFKLGLISEGEWRDVLDHDPVLSEHFRVHHVHVGEKL